MGSILRGRRMLVVEDEFLIALDLQRLLEEAGAQEVHLASTIAEARRLLLRGIAFDLAILDRRLGGEDTSELIGNMSALGIAVLVVTGLSADALPAGIQVVRKPFRDEEVIASIRKTLGI